MSSDSELPVHTPPHPGNRGYYMDIEHKVMGEYLMTPKNDHDKVTGKTNLVEKWAEGAT